MSDDVEVLVTWTYPVEVGAGKRITIPLRLAAQPIPSDVNDSGNWRILIQQATQDGEWVTEHEEHATTRPTVHHPDAQPPTTDTTSTPHNHNGSR